MVEDSLRRGRSLAPRGGRTPMPIHTDPVCHMQVDQNTAAAVSEHAGRKYYFCSPGCKEKFDRNPGQYASATR
jgi:YHS domain-containing protein